MTAFVCALLASCWISASFALQQASLQSSLLNQFPSTVPLAIEILQIQAQSGLPLDTSLRKFVKSYSIQGPRRDVLSDLLFSTARNHGRLDWRLRAAGIPCSPENRVALEVYHACGGKKMALELLSGNVDWLWSLGPSREVEGMDQRCRLECPEWAWPSFLQSFPGSYEAELRGLQDPAPLDLRVNLLKTTPGAALTAIRGAGFDASPGPFSSTCIRLPERNIALGSLPGLLEGHVEPTDEGSQLICELVAAKPGECVTDFCAGSGGKTLGLSAQMQNKGVLWVSFLPT